MLGAPQANASDGVCGPIGTHWADNKGYNSYVCTRAQAVMLVRDALKNGAQIDMYLGQWVSSGRSTSFPTNQPTAFPSYNYLVDTQAGTH